MRQRIPKLSDPAHTHEAGFSLLELLMVVAILTVVLGVVVRGAVELQARSATEVAKVDLTQQSRQFMDQVVKDLHHAGYPSVRMYDQATSTANPALYGQGLINISSNAIVFEGDVDGRRLRGFCVAPDARRGGLCGAAGARAGHPQCHADLPLGMERHGHDKPPLHHLQQPDPRRAAQSAG